MSAEIFRTVVPMQSSSDKVSYKSSSLLVGSCFTENIGSKLNWYKFPTIVNPFGITYNPASVKTSLERLISGIPYKAGDLHEHDGLYFSFDHHSRFSDQDPHTCLQKINDSFNEGRSTLEKASHLFITFGTSYFYILKSDNQIVSNCHKIPDGEFIRKRLNVEEIVSDYKRLINSLLNINPSVKLIFTVSPIRHWKDGAHENQLSKAVLFLAIDELCREFDALHYFPAFELMMDELRDYRFYEEDMIHPNKIAVEFIWKRFVESFVDNDTQRIMLEIEKIRSAVQHRPFNTSTESFRKFVHQQIKKIEQVSDSYPELDLSEEYHYFTHI
jgi:hypothetical protein